MVGPAIFRDLAQAIGAAQLRDALRQLRAEGGPIDSWRLLIGLERISGRSLTSIFRARVFPPEQNPWLDQRDALRRRIEQAESLSVHSDIKLPVSLREAFDAGGFAAAAGLLDQLEPSLELIGAIEGSCGRLALSCDRYWRPLPETTRDLAALLLRLRESHDFLGRYAVLHDSARALGIGIPAELTQAAAALQPTDVVRQANVSLLYGQVLEKRCTEHQIACMRWRELWSNNQIAVADSLMQGVTTMLDRAAGLEQAYTGTGWPCGRAWRAFFERSGDPQKTIKFIADAQAAKPELALAASIVAPSSGIARRLLAPILGLDAATLLDSARLAFAEGDLARALTLAQEARAAQLAGVSHGAWLAWPIGGALIGLGVLLAVIVVARKRRRARAQDAHDRLLADLLKQPPGKDGKKGDEKTRKAA